MNIAISIVSGEDWEGLYINGALQNQGHSVSVLSVINALKRHGIEIVYNELCVDDLWLEGRYSLPDNLSDVAFER